jgi:seryl-tRNA synthetase
MHYIKNIKANLEKFDLSMKRRGLAIRAEILLELDEKVREAKGELQALQEKINQISKEIGYKKSRNDESGLENLIKEVEPAKTELPIIKNKLEQLEEELKNHLISLPNLLDDAVPEGKDEKDNLVVRVVGERKLLEGREHFQLGEELALIDFEKTAQISGSRFVTLKGDLARLERALISFFLDINSSFGYEEFSTPYLVREATMFGVGQLPKFAEDSFKIEGSDYRLIPTAEVTLTSLVADSLVKEEELPLRFTGWTPCFRSEAGSAGRDTRGMVRLHQFSKVELVSLTRPEDSHDELERMVSVAETILQKLALPYRVLLLSSGDTGFCSSKTYDLEVWLPGQKNYREISSCSNCKDFQTIRMKAKYKSSQGSNQFLHSLNGSALPIGRTLLAIMENYQNPDGSISIPTSLIPYFGKDKISK